MNPTEIKAQLASARQANQDIQNHIAQLERELEQAEKKPLPIEQVVVECKDEYDLGAVVRQFIVLGYHPDVNYVSGSGYQVSVNGETCPTHSPEGFFAQYPVSLAREEGPPPNGTKVWHIWSDGSIGSFEFTNTYSSKFMWYTGYIHLTEAEARAEVDRINSLIIKHTTR